MHCSDQFLIHFNFTNYLKNEPLSRILKYGNDFNEHLNLFEKSDVKSKNNLGKLNISHIYVNQDAY